ncbi:hypothetical protein [Propionicimonas sp.]|uniref:hypothetical protein n=1 Tax=Propionicimonas sp. TaxID=1955623 RepID=UPI0039E608A6
MNERARPSTEDFLAALEKDEDYQRRLAEAEAEADAQAEMLAVAEVPLTRALHAAGVDVESVWEVYPKLAGYALALPVLVEHLERGGYPDLTTDALGQALCARAAEPYWDRLRAIYLSPRTEAEEVAVAIALSGAAGPKQFDDLVELVGREDRGDSRLFFLRPINRIGRERGRAVVAALRDHPLLGAEATAILKGRSPNE